MSKHTHRILGVFTFVAAMIVLLFSCKKDEAPNIQTLTIEREYFNYGPTAVTVTGVYSYGGKINSIKMHVGRRTDFNDARAYEADIDGTNFTVEVPGLQAGTEYGSPVKACV